MRLRLRFFPFALALAAVAGSACSKNAPPKPKERAAAGDIAIVGATVVPMDKPGALPARTVLVRGDKIVLVAPEADVDTTGATVIDGHGKWLLPGLADMHVHFWGEGDLSLFLLNGVTTVRNLFGSPQHLTWRDKIAKGELAGPTIITAGPIIDGDPPVWPGSDVVTTAEQARAVVKRQKEAGYDWLKVYNGLSVEAYDAIMAEAKAQGMPVAGHVPKAVGIEKAVAAGQRTIEHLDGYVPFFGEPKVGPEIVAATAAAPVWNCPTLIVTDNFGKLDHPEQLEQTPGLELVTKMVHDQWNPKNDFRLQTFTPEKFETVRKNNEVRRKLLGDLSKAGAKIIVGTDTGNPYVVPGFAVHEELALMVAAGLSREEVLRDATVVPAEVLGTPGAFGAVVPGARADLILLDGDPLADLAAARSPSVVIARGKVHKREELLAAIQESLKPVAPADLFAGLPEIPVEGTPEVSASYDVILQDETIGGERAVFSSAGKGRSPIVRGQAVYKPPMQATFIYRATPESLEIGDKDGANLHVVWKDKKVLATPSKGSPFDLDAPMGAIIAPQTIAEFFWYGYRLADLKIGAKRDIDSVEVMADTGYKLVPAHFTFTRKPDTDGRHVYDIVGKNGGLDLTGNFTVDSDGAPHEVSVTVKWGTFITRRTK